MAEAAALRRCACGRAARHVQRGLHDRDTGPAICDAAEITQVDAILLGPSAVLGDDDRQAVAAMHVEDGVAQRNGFDPPTDRRGRGGIRRMLAKRALMRRNRVRQFRRVVATQLQIGQPTLALHRLRQVPMAKADGRFDTGSKQRICQAFVEAEASRSPCATDRSVTAAQGLAWRMARGSVLASAMLGRIASAGPAPSA